MIMLEGGLKSPPFSMAGRISLSTFAGKGYTVYCPMKRRRATRGRDPVEGWSDAATEGKRGVRHGAARVSVGAPHPFHQAVSPSPLERPMPEKIPGEARFLIIIIPF
jgi:hypothetical protein